VRLAVVPLAWAEALTVAVVRHADCPARRFHDRREERPPIVIANLVRWLVLSISVGSGDVRRGNSFLAVFVLSALFTPVIGLIAVAATSKRTKADP
jgi:hypothetical protein